MMTESDRLNLELIKAGYGLKYTSLKDCVKQAILDHNYVSPIQRKPDPNYIPPASKLSRKKKSSLGKQKYAPLSDEVISKYMRRIAYRSSDDKRVRETSIEFLCDILTSIGFEKTVKSFKRNIRPKINYEDYLK